MVKIYRSDPWMRDDIDEINQVLSSAIEDFSIYTGAIINIQVVKSESRLSRFWIYVKE